MSAHIKWTDLGKKTQADAVLKAREFQNEKEKKDIADARAKERKDFQFRKLQTCLEEVAAHCQAALEEFNREIQFEGLKLSSHVLPDGSLSVGRCSKGPSVQFTLNKDVPALFARRLSYGRAMDEEGYSYLIDDSGQLVETMTAVPNYIADRVVTTAAQIAEKAVLWVVKQKYFPSDLAAPYSAPS